MLALYFDGKLGLKEVARPEPQGGEVLVRVRLAGICGTDLQVLKGYHDFRGILGHEFVGEVVGPHDSSWRGRRVVGEINLPCGCCGLCLRGLERHCRERRVLGLKNKDGALAEYLTLPGANLHEVPPEVPDEAAVFTEPLAAALRVVEVTRLPLREPVLVIGDGKLGLLISWVLAVSGAEVHLAGHQGDRLNLSRPYGVLTTLAKDLPPGDYELVVEASGSPQGLDLALKRVRPQGTVVLKSTYTGRFALDPGALVVPEVRLIGSRCGPFPPALRLLKKGWIDPRPLIQDRFPLSRGLDAITRAQQPGTLKVLIDCGGEGRGK
jgi:alcohol dehydrogenase